MLTSRQRVLNAITRQPTDRVPYHFRAEPVVYDALKAAFGLADDEAVRRWAGSDVRDAAALFGEGGYGGYSGFGWRDRALPGGVQEDFWGVRRERVRNQGGEFIEIVHCPLQGRSFAEVRAHPWPDPRQLFDFSALAARIRQWNGDREYF